VRDLNHSGLLS